MNPLSQISRRSLESKADALAVALETSPLNGVFARRPDSSPVVLWLHDDGEDVSKAPTKVAVAFPDDFVLWGPSERPNDVAYAGISLGIDTKRPDSEPYDAMIGTDGFAELYREASLDDLDAHSGLRDRVIAAVRERRPDLSFGEEPAPEGTAPSP
jgi:hypothetical protein